MKLIVSATDGSGGAERAVAVAAALAKATNAKLLIVHISSDDFTGEQIRLLGLLQVAEGDALEQISAQILLKAKTIAHDHGAIDIATMTGAGEPAKALMDILNDEHADAIVVERRGRGQLEGWLLGIVSQKLSCLAGCIVVIVP